MNNIPNKKSLNKCFDCQKYTCEGCDNLEPDMKLINPTTEKPLSKEDIDKIMEELR